MKNIFSIEGNVEIRPIGSLWVDEAVRLRKAGVGSMDIIPILEFAKKSSLEDLDK